MNAKNRLRNAHHKVLQSLLSYLAIQSLVQFWVKLLYGYLFSEWFPPINTWKKGCEVEYADVTAEKLKDHVLSVISDEKIKENIRNIQKLIEKAPGNSGGAEMIIEYYKNISLK